MCKVLVVDDEPLIVKSLTRIFRGFGFSLFTAHNPFEALSIIKHQPVDILITDFQMQGMSGVQLARHAKRMQPAIGAIVLTATPEEARTELGDEGAKGAVVVDKPWDIKKLLDLVAPLTPEAA